MTRTYNLDAVLAQHGLEVEPSSPRTSRAARSDREPGLPMSSDSPARLRSSATLLGAWPGTIWYKWSAKTALKNTIDGFLYALVTGAMFGWLWP